MKRLARVPLHTGLFAAYAVVFLWSQNLNKVEPGEVALPFVASVAGALLVFGAWWLVLRDVLRAALIATLWAFVFFSYGHFADVLLGKKLGPVHLGGDTFLLPLAALIAIAGAAAIVFKMKRRPERATAGLNAILAVLLLVSLVTVVTDVAKGSSSPVIRPGATPAAVEKPKDAPDIYYFILDRYAGAETLDQYFDYDNSSFIEQLRARGFFVADEARGNYPKTPHSLATSLNMQYLDDMPEDSKDWRKVYSLLPSSKVVRFLKDRGYFFNYVTSRYHALQTEPLADRQWKHEVGTATWSGFTQALADSTMVSALASRLGVDSLDPRRQEYERIKWEFETVPRAKEISRRQEKPVFTFAHLYVGHDPYVFDAKGSYVDEEKERSIPWRQAYVEQLKYSNEKLLELVDELLNVPAAERPVILMQADEGPGPEGWSMSRPEHYDWTEASQATLEEKFRLMVAFHAPGAEDLYTSITPVNNFRLLFNEYFDAGFDLLPDRSYVFKDELQPYDFIDVTDRVKD